MIKNSILNIVDRGLKALLSLALLVLLSHYSTTETFGLMMLMLVYRQVSLVVCSLGSDNFFLQSIVQRIHEKNEVKCFLEHFLLRLCVVILLSIVSFTFLDKSHMYMVISGGLLALSSLVENYNRAKNQVHFNIIGYIFTIIFISFYYYTLLIEGYISFSSAYSLILLEAFMGFVILIFLFIFNAKINLRKIVVRVSFSSLNSYIFASLSFSALLAILQSRIDILVLESLGGLTEVAELGLASRLVSLLFIPITAFNTVLIVRVNELKQNGVGSEIFHKFNQLAVIFTYLLILCSSVIFYIIFPIAFDEKYSNSLNIFYIYVIMLIPMSVLHLQTIWYYKDGLISFALYKNIATLLFSTLLLLFVIPSYGTLGAASVMVISSFCNAYLFNFFNAKAFLILKYSYKDLFFASYRFIKKGY